MIAKKMRFKIIIKNIPVVNGFQKINKIKKIKI